MSAETSHIAAFSKSKAGCIQQYRRLGMTDAPICAVQHAPTRLASHFSRGRICGCLADAVPYTRSPVKLCIPRRRFIDDRVNTNQPARLSSDQHNYGASGEMDRALLCGLLNAPTSFPQHLCVLSVGFGPRAPLISSQLRIASGYWR